jgi:hypothetical protein
VDVTFLHGLLLGRDASPTELAAQTGEDLVSVVTTLARSSAHREFMRTVLDEDVVRLYRAILQRDPENDDVVAQRVGRPFFEVALELARSEEFRTRARTATAADVESLYRLVLGRPPESRAVVSARMGRPLVDVALDVVQSAEARAAHRMEIAELQEWCTLFLGAPADDVWARELVDILRSFRLGKVALLEHLLRMHLRRRGIVAAHGSNSEEATPRVSLKKRPDYAPTRHFGSKITLVVPTFDSESWIRSVVDFYDGIGVRPLYAVDGRTGDRTREILAARSQNWITVAATAPRVEAMLPGILRQVDTPWVLRLDDDELPAPELLQCCDQAVERHDAPVWGFPRLCLRWSPGRQALEYSTFLTFGAHVDMDRQWRLFRPDCVTLRDEVHTPGFDSSLKARAPSDARILHFDWVLRTPSRRREKALSYESQAGSSEHPRQVLHEAIPEEWHLFEILEHPRSRDFARQIYQALR